MSIDNGTVRGEYMEGLTMELLAKKEEREMEEKMIQEIMDQAEEEYFENYEPDPMDIADRRIYIQAHYKGRAICVEETDGGRILLWAPGYSEEAVDRLRGLLLPDPDEAHDLMELSMKEQLEVEELFSGLIK